MSKNTLEELFVEWQAAQIAETNDSCRKKTFPIKDALSANKYTDEYIERFKPSFCYDGFADPNSSKTIPGHAHLLFVLKEAHLTTMDEEGRLEPETKDKDKFWFVKDPKQIYRNKLNHCLDYIGIQGITTYDFQYMNLNKRGGYDKTNRYRLNNYVNVYKEFIKQQVSILNPDIIICCGCYDAFMKICYGHNTWVKNGKKPGTIIVNGKPVNVYYIYHPSVRSVGRFYGSLKTLQKQMT